MLVTFSLTQKGAQHKEPVSVAWPAAHGGAPGPPPSDSGVCMDMGCCFLMAPSEAIPHFFV
eukprot:11200407-Lingulodinium_polyedra.AAC.1